MFRKLNILILFQVQQRSAGRRRTWAESSVFHGGVATSYAGGVAGALSYASEQVSDFKSFGSGLPAYKVLMT